jgi:hypothetical protein
MRKKRLTITIEESVYRGLHRHVGAGNISRFIESLIRPHVMVEDLEAAYAEMARDDRRETEALEWAEGSIGEVSKVPE